MTPEETREWLAELAYDQEADWTRYMLDVLEPLLAYGRGVADEAARHGVADARATAAREALTRWKREIETPYADLTEKEKDSVREWADKVIGIVNRAKIEVEE